MQDEGQPQNQPGWVFSPGGETTPTATEVTAQISHEPQVQQPVAAPIAPVVQSQPVITPPAPLPAPAPVAAITPPPAPEATVTPVVAVPTTPSVAEAPAESSPVFQAPSSRPDDPDSVSWTASEYVSHSKTTGWFVALGVATFIISVFIYLLTSDILSAVVVAVIGIAVAVVAARHPNEQQYSLDNAGIRVGQKFYGYGLFKSFTVLHEGAFGYVSLAPLKRFMPPLALHYGPDDADRIIDILADYLPFEERKRDVIDNLSNRLRF